MNVYGEIRSNTLKTYLILLLFFALISALVYVFGKALGANTGVLLLMSFLVSMFLTVGSYFYSDKIVLGIHGAREAKRTEYFDLYTVVENLAIASGLPKPKVYVIPDPAPNAFATGRDPKHAVVAVTTGLLSLMDRSELEGVIAHELAHIKNFDIRLSMIVAVLVGLVVLLADWGGRSLVHSSSDRENRGSAIFVIIGIFLMLIAPLFASLLQLAISRKREYLADATAVLLTRYPVGLIRALEKLGADNQRMATANNGTAHLFIENPLGSDKRKVSWWAGLFSTHPPLNERIARLQAM